MNRWKYIAIVLLNVVGIFGFLLALQGVTPDTWIPAVQLSSYASSLIGILVTVLATLSVAIAAYARLHNRPPDFVSSFVVAPIVIIMIAVASGNLIVTRTLPNLEIVNGLALMGLAGGVLRMLSYSEWQDGRLSRLETWFGKRSWPQRLRAWQTKPRDS